VIFLLSSSLEKQGIPYRAAKQICIKGRQFQKGESFSSRASFQALAHCEAQQLEGINCLVVKSDDMLTIWREIPRHEVVLPAAGQSNQYAESIHPGKHKSLEKTSADRDLGFFNRSPLSKAPQPQASTKTPKAKSNKHSPMDVQRLMDWIIDA
jgi:hypothetical protein